MVIGGGQVYAEAMHIWGRCYLTVVEGDFRGTTYFPLQELLLQGWRPARKPETYGPDEKNQHGHSFHVIDRAAGSAPGSPLLEGSLARLWAGPEKALQGLDLAAILARGTMGP
jgi:hypothetical protein